MDPNEDFLPDDWEKYQRMGEFGQDLADELKTLLLADNFKEARLLIGNEDVEVVGYFVHLLCDDVATDEFVLVFQSLTLICLRRLEDLEIEKDREDLRLCIESIIASYMGKTRVLTQRAIEHSNKSAQGTKQLRIKTEKAHEEILEKAWRMKTINPALSKKRIGELLIQKGETNYRPSTVSEILKSLNEFIRWKNGRFF
jgi:hypothetical protein